MELFFATSNRNKVKEVEAILGHGWEVRCNLDFPELQEVEEPYDSLEENSLHKAKTFYTITGIPCIAEDTGLEVEALNGAPGVKSARYAGAERSDEKNIAKLLQELEGKDNRRARFRTVITYFGREEIKPFEGIVQGQIADKPSGNKGFGYDPIFIPEQETRTFAEMDLQQKSLMSHRGRAVAALIAFLKQKQTSHTQIV